MQQQIIKETYQLVSKRDDNVCNFLEGGRYLVLLRNYQNNFGDTTLFCIAEDMIVLFIFSLIGGSDYKLIYRHYATLYFVFCVDSSESELGILDLIQVFVETLDKCFENVCELDLIFHADCVHHILSELVMGGMVLQTNMADILARIEDQNKLQKQEVKLFNIVSFFKIFVNVINLFIGWIISSACESRLRCEEYEFTSTN